MNLLPAGTAVKQVVPVITGVTADRRLNDASGQIEYLVAYLDADGHAAERWFLADQIEATAPTATADTTEEAK